MRLFWTLSAGFAAMFAAPIAAQFAPAAPPEAIAPDFKSATSQGIAQNGPVVVPQVQDSRPPIIPTANFAARNNFRSAKLSPDGNLIAVQMEVMGEPNIVLFNANTREPVKRGAIGTKVDLEWFRWAGNNKVLVSASKSGDFFGDESLYTRLFLFNITNGDFDLIGTEEPVLTGDDVIYVAPDASYLLLTLQATPYEYPSVYRYDLDGKNRGKRIIKPNTGVWNYFADSAGIVRIGSGWSNGKLRVYFRKNGDDRLELLGKFKEGDSDASLWEVAYIKAGSDTGFVLDRGGHGRIELQSFDFAKGQKIDTIYANPDWDIDGATIKPDGLPLAAYYTDDRDRVVWLQEKERDLQAALEGALKEEEVWVSSLAQDGSKMLVLGGSEADPGALYVFSPEQSRIDLFGELRPQIRSPELTKPKSVQYEARDGTPIAAYLTLPRGREAVGLPLILLPHGGPYGVRDQLRYDDEVQLLANRGYAVLQPNYRGSGGYGAAFTNLGTGQIGRKMQDDLDDGMDWAVTQGIADPERVCVVGGSYGGYAALWAAVRNPERYRCAASWAGVTDWDSQLKYDRNFFTRSGGKKWRSRVEGNEEGFDLDSVSPASQAARLTRPILLAHGEDDTNVPFKQFKKMRDATKDASVPVELLVIEGEGHSFSKPKNEQKWYDTLIAFLATHNPAD